MPNYGIAVTQKREAFVQKYYGELGYSAEYCADKLGMSISGIEKVAARLRLQKRKMHGISFYDFWIIAMCEDGNYLLEINTSSFKKHGFALSSISHSLRNATYTKLNKKKWYFSQLKDYRGYGYLRAYRPDSYYEACRIEDGRKRRHELPSRLKKKDALLFASLKLNF